MKSKPCNDTLYRQYVVQGSKHPVRTPKDHPKGSWGGPKDACEDCLEACEQARCGGVVRDAQGTQRVLPQDLRCSLASEADAHLTSPTQNLKKIWDLDPRRAGTSQNC